jgi:hypothetical protein
MRQVYEDDGRPQKAPGPLSDSYCRRYLHTSLKLTGIEYAIHLTALVPEDDRYEVRQVSETDGYEVHQVCPIRWTYITQYTAYLSQHKY